MPSLLVFSRTTGYRHESIPAGVAAVAELAAELGVTVDATEDADMFDADLSRYEFTDDPRPRVHVLLSVDESTYEGGAMRPGHPIAWQHSVGAGLCFYTALGHPIEAYADPTFRTHLAGGIRSVM